MRTRASTGAGEWSRASERAALQHIQTTTGQQVDAIVHRWSRGGDPKDQMNDVRTLKREARIQLLETQREFAAGRGDLKTEREAEAALRFWTEPPRPPSGDAVQSFDKNGDRP